MGKRVALYDLTHDDDSDSEIEGESIVFTQKIKYRFLIFNKKLTFFY